jgi:enolase-phosphatase E1
MTDTQLSANTRGILLDIEGTTSSISFVYDTMFPYVRENLRYYLESSWDSADFQSCLPQLATDAGEQEGNSVPTVERWLGAHSTAKSIDMVETAVIRLMDADVKATGLKQLQGKIWKNGFESGQLIAHLFDDVAPAIKQWHAVGIDIRIYSSGSIASQKLFFGHTIAGNLLPYLNGHYDTTTGPKREPDSYQKIAGEFNFPAEQVVFISDIPDELTAAQPSGMPTVLSLRPGNKPVPATHNFTTTDDFQQLL